MRKSLSLFTGWGFRLANKVKDAAGLEKQASRRRSQNWA
jgi:hypothetical protein